MSEVRLTDPASPAFQGAGQPIPDAPREAPDASLVTKDGNARCSLWWKAVPRRGSDRVGVIGHYSSADDAAAQVVLHAALERLKAAGCTLAIGPIDGSTWRKYRFVTKTNGDPAFFLEPTNPAEWPIQWQAAGFVPLEEYVSCATAGPIVVPRLPMPRGVTIRTLDMSRFEHELEALFDMSLRSFSRNLLYTPLSKADFLAMYIPLKSALDPRILLVAEQAGKAVGFAFCLPDHAERSRPTRTAIVKTMAVEPEAMGQGLGTLMGAAAVAACVDAGYTRLVAALMHVDNRSRRISEHYGPVFRRYAVFSRSLQ